MTRFSVKHRGLSLVELLVAMSLSLVVVAAAAYLYLSTRDNQSKLDQSADASEVGNYVLRMLGRDVGNAGFYPSASAELAQPNVVNVYSNITTYDAYNHGIYGCDGAPFDMATHTCGTPVTGAPDTLVIAYYTSDAFGGMVGQRNDCEGEDVATASVNASRVNTGTSSIAPGLPLFAANHYTLQTSASSSMTFDGRMVATRSLLCKGLVSASDEPYRRIIAGLDDFQVMYGVSGTPAAAGQAPPVRFMRADEVVWSAWRQVVAVRLCVVTRTYETANAVGSDTEQWQDCDGVTHTETDHSLRKIYTQVFSVRNHLNATY